MNRAILKLSFVTLLFVWIVSLEANAEPRRKKNRNRNNRRRNNDYNDNEEESLLGQFSGDTYADFMERYYGGVNKGSTSLDWPCCSLREESQVYVNFLDFVLGPLLERHVLLAQLEEPFVVADALVTVQDLPNE